MKTSKVLLRIIFLSALMIGCSPDIPTQDMPEVNDENCKPVNIEKIKDKGTQQKFASECLHRSSGFKPSKKREW